MNLNLFVCPKATDECIGNCRHAMPHNEIMKCHNGRCSKHGDLDCTDDIKVIRKYKLNKIVSTNEN